MGPDGQQTCVIATLQPTATKKLRLVLGRPLKRAPLRMQRPVGVVFKALEKCDVPVDDVRLGGPPVDNVAIDEEGERTLIRLSGLSGLLGLGLAWWSLRSIGMTIIVFACGISVPRLPWPFCGSLAKTWMPFCYRCLRWCTC